MAVRSALRPWLADTRGIGLPGLLLLLSLLLALLLLLPLRLLVRLPLLVLLDSLLLLLQCLLLALQLLLPLCLFTQGALAQQFLVPPLLLLLGALLLLQLARLCLLLFQLLLRLLPLCLLAHRALAGQFVVLSSLQFLLAGQLHLLTLLLTLELLLRALGLLRRAALGSVPCLLLPCHGALLAFRVALQLLLLAPGAVLRILGAAVLRVGGRAGSCGGELRARQSCCWRR